MTGICPTCKTKFAKHHSTQRTCSIACENERRRQGMAGAVNYGKLTSFVEGLAGRLPTKPPAWVPAPKKRAGDKLATPTAFFSDAHFGEVVDPEKIEGLNAYDRVIAGRRLRTFFEHTVSLAKDYLKGLSYSGIVVPFGGDIFSGDIHEELVATNQGTVQEEVLHWLDPVASGLTFLAEEFGKVYVPAVVGNHPRGTKKPSHKLRVPNNFDWLFTMFLAKLLKGDPRITFNISPAADVVYDVLGTRYRLSHGDQFRGGSGIAGLLSPLMIGDARKRKRSQVAGRGYDWLLLGHWHQRSKFKNIIVNGSLKGYDEFAYDNNFDWEPAQQSFWITDPKHGVTIDAPILVQDDKEGK